MLQCVCGGNMGFFLPLTGLFYGIVPREQRVLAFSAASLVYTTILSLWKGARDRQLEVARSAAVLCCSVLQCLAVCCSVLQCVAVCLRVQGWKCAFDRPGLVHDSFVTDSFVTYLIHVIHALCMCDMTHSYLAEEGRSRPIV